MPLMVDADVAAIERATAAAVAPEQILEHPGWLLPMDRGTVARARSAVPLHHGAMPLADLDAIAARYRAAGFAPELRLPDVPSFSAWHAHLQTHGWRAEQSTWTRVAPVEALLALPDGGWDVQVQPQPDAAWMAMYLGAGLDPVDGASRAAALARARGLYYLSVRQGGETVACGAACFDQGWLGVHGMRTAMAERGRGLAAGVLRAMGQAAQQRGIARAFLQVDVHNHAALALYGRAGFVPAWTYAYWRC